MAGEKCEERGAVEEKEGKEDQRRDGEEGGKERGQGTGKCEGRMSEGRNGGRGPCGGGRGGRGEWRSIDDAAIVFVFAGEASASRSAGGPPEPPLNP